MRRQKRMEMQGHIINDIGNDGKRDNEAGTASVQKII